MTALRLEGHQGKSVDIDLCKACQAFWFDKYESLQLSASSTLHLLRLVGEQTTPGVTSITKTMHCPRCSSRLLPTQDMQRATRFNYFRCPFDHGRFIRFFEFLREKDFIRPLTPKQIAELREHVQTVNCANCGGPVDLAAGAACPHCSSPLSILDMKQPQRLLAQLQEASEPKPVDPALPLNVLRAKREVELLFHEEEQSERVWWGDASSADLVHACLGTVARWLK